MQDTFKFQQACGLAKEMGAYIEPRSVLPCERCKLPYWRLYLVADTHFRIGVLDRGCLGGKFQLCKKLA